MLSALANLPLNLILRLPPYSPLFFHSPDSLPPRLPSPAGTPKITPYPTPSLHRHATPLENSVRHIGHPAHERRHFGREVQRPQIDGMRAGQGSLPSAVNAQGTAPARRLKGASEDADPAHKTISAAVHTYINQRIAGDVRGRADNMLLLSIGNVGRPPFSLALDFRQPILVNPRPRPWLHAQPGSDAFDSPTRQHPAHPGPALDRLTRRNGSHSIKLSYVKDITLHYLRHNAPRRPSQNNKTASCALTDSPPPSAACLQVVDIRKQVSNVCGAGMHPLRPLSACSPLP
ncbi:hypothetical protein K438DRAFT_2012192 [Mycena galopus ATCC 62051]|nr:hypothetical protein K438DRAFT_2012192 [Mycena galopus ATCC 62051]